MRKSLFISLLLAAICDVSIAQTSFLDPAFGSGGIVLTHLGSATSNGEIASVVMQPDNKIIAGGGAVGQGIVIRYKENGSIDSSFATNGIFTNPTMWANALALQPDGKIVGAGGSTAFRLNADGSLDNTFGSGGIVTTGFDIDCYSLALQSDGKIVIAGYEASTYIGIVRLLTNGIPDSTFGTYGLETGHTGSAVKGIAILPDGRMVTGGNSFGFSFMATRFLSNGAIDTTFNHTGFATTLTGDTYDYCNALLLQADGKIVLGGSGTFGASGSDFVLTRYNPDGSLDRTFGDTGVAHIDFNKNDDEIRAMFLMSNGKIIVAGDAVITSNKIFALSRFNTDGSMDSTFGTDGKISTDIQGYADFAEAVTMQKDGKIILGGNSAIGNYPNNYSECALVRYVDQSVGIGQISDPTTIILYPNPTTEKINISGACSAHITRIKAFDVSGKEIGIRVDRAQKEILLNRMAEGVYFFKINFDDRPYLIQKVLVRDGK